MPDHIVAFPEKLLKTIATRYTIFSLKFTKNRLAAGLCLDPLGELKRSPRPTSRNMGPTFKGRGGRGEGGGKVKGEGIIHLLLPPSTHSCRRLRYSLTFTVEFCTL